MKLRVKGGHKASGMTNTVIQKREWTHTRTVDVRHSTSTLWACREREDEMDVREENGKTTTLRDDTSTVTTTLKGSRSYRNDRSSVSRRREQELGNTTHLLDQ